MALICDGARLPVTHSIAAGIGCHFLRTVKQEKAEQVGMHQMSWLEKRCFQTAD